MRYKNLLLISLLTFSIQACKKDTPATTKGDNTGTKPTTGTTTGNTPPSDTNTGTQIETPIQLKSITDEYGFSSRATYSYTYNNTGYLTLIHPFPDTDFPEGDTKVTYNTAGKIVKMISETTSTDYIYNNTGQLVSSTTITNYKEPDLKTETTATYNYLADGKLFSVLVNPPGDDFSYTYEYDDTGILKKYTLTKFPSNYKETTLVEKYNDEMNINPVVLSTLSRDLNYWALPGVKIFPRLLTTYDDKGVIVATQVFNLSINNKKVTRFLWTYQSPKGPLSLIHTYTFNY